ncbi:MAG: hypothetical protein IPH62_11455 [Ignavibacteriae bacterium]|nr:hypothetical protein [Ignavibacteriota bacterium]
MKNLINILTLTLIISSGNFAQGFGSYGSVDAKNISLAGTNAISATGVYAIGVNPANLVLEQEHSIEISTVLPFPNLNISAGNDFITLDDYQYYFTGEENGSGQIIGKYLDDAEKNKFLGLFENGSMINSNFGTTIFSASIYPSKELGAFAFSIQDWVSANVSLPKQIFELVLFGNETEKVFDLQDMDLKSWYLRNYTLSYAKDLSFLFPDAFKSFSAGITLKMVHGFFYAGVDEINTTLQTLNNYNIQVNGDSKMLMAASPSFGIKYDFEDDDVEKEKNIGLFNKPAGTGFGVDLGFHSELNNAWSIAFALTDLGSINWNKEAIEYSSSASYLLEDITDETLLDSLGEAITGEGKFINEFSTSLATAMKIGVGLKVDKFLKGNFPGKLLVEFNYHQGFNEMPSNSLEPRFSLGSQWSPWNWFNVRSGVSVGGFDGFNWAFGLGFNSGLIDFDFATSYVHSLFDGNNAKRLGFAMSSRWKF